MDIGSATAKSAPPQVRLALDANRGLVDEILERFDVLTQRLEPVVNHRPDAMDTPSGDEPSLAPLASEIEHTNVRLVLLRDRLVYYISILEV
jgi:hypothetical protein